VSKSGQWQWRPRDIGRGREKDSDGIEITEGWNRRGGYTDSRNGRQWTARIAMVGAVINVRRIRRRIRRATMFGEQKAEDEERWDMGWQRFGRVSASRMRTCGRRRIREKAWARFSYVFDFEPQAPLEAHTHMPNRRISGQRGQGQDHRVWVWLERRHLYLVCVLLAGWVLCLRGRRSRREENRTELVGPTRNASEICSKGEN